MKLRHLLPPALIAILLALAAIAQAAAPKNGSVRTVPTDPRCSDGGCLFMMSSNSAGN